MITQELIPNKLRLTIEQNEDSDYLGTTAYARTGTFNCRSASSLAHRVVYPLHIMEGSPEDSKVSINCNSYVFAANWVRKFTETLSNLSDYIYVESDTDLVNSVLERIEQNKNPVFTLSDTTMCRPTNVSVVCRSPDNKTCTVYELNFRPAYMQVIEDGLVWSFVEDMIGVTGAERALRNLCYYLAPKATFNQSSYDLTNPDDVEELCLHLNYPDVIELPVGDSGIDMFTNSIGLAYAVYEYNTQLARTHNELRLR